MYRPGPVHQATQWLPAHRPGDVGRKGLKRTPMHPLSPTARPGSSRPPTGHRQRPVARRSSFGERALFRAHPAGASLRLLLEMRLQAVCRGAPLPHLRAGLLSLCLLMWARKRGHGPPCRRSCPRQFVCRLMWARQARPLLGECSARTSQHRHSNLAERPSTNMRASRHG